MAFEVQERKVGYLTAPHNFYIKLDSGISFGVSIGGTEFRCVCVTPELIEVARNRPEKPKDEPAATSVNYVGQMILGKPVQITPQVVQDPYYDEEIVQFLLQLRFDDYFIVMIQDETKVIKHE